MLTSEKHTHCSIDPDILSHKTVFFCQVEVSKLTSFTFSPITLSTLIPLPSTTPLVSNRSRLLVIVDVSTFHPLTTRVSGDSWSPDLSHRTLLRRNSLESSLSSPVSSPFMGIDRKEGERSALRLSFGYQVIGSVTHPQSAETPCLVLSFSVSSRRLLSFAFRSGVVGVPCEWTSNMWNRDTYRYSRRSWWLGRKEERQHYRFIARCSVNHLPEGLVSRFHWINLVTEN